MAGWKRWIDRAKSYVPEEVRDAGRRVRDRVIERAPAPIAAAIERITVGEPEVGAEPEATGSVHATEASAEPTRTEPTHVEPTHVEPAHVEPTRTEPTRAEPTRAEPSPLEDPEAVLRRVKAKAERGLKPEDTLVVIYATDREREAVAQIARLFDGIDTTVRVMDLDREPQTKRQMARLTDVMVPPYVFINGRHWGGPYEIEALAATGDLPKVVANLLDEIGTEARRIGKLRETYSDEMTVANIVERWRLGHILCVDDLDTWLERDKDGRERFFYQGGERPVDTLEQVAAEIVHAVENGVEAQWLLDPVVHVH